MAKAHVMTAKRKIALRKAQIASARKRKGTGKARLSPRTKRNIKRAAIGAGVVGAVAGGAVVRHKVSGSTFTVRKAPNKTMVKGKPFVKRYPKHGGKQVTVLSRAHGATGHYAVYTHKPLKNVVHGRKTKDIQASINKIKPEHMGPRRYPTPSTRTIRSKTGKSVSFSFSQEYGHGLSHVTQRSKGQRTNKANPHEDVVAAYRKHKPVIGSVHTARSVTPKVRVGPPRTTKKIKNYYD